MAQIHQGDALPFIKVPRIQTRVVAGEQTGTEEMTVWEQWMEPDGFIPIHFHDTEEVLFIVEGTIRLELADSFLECVAPASITVSAYELHGRSGSPVFFLYVLSICFLSDIGGYSIGKLIGGKKLTKISPNKTISGTIGSFSFSILTPILFYNFDQYEYSLSINNFLFCLLVSLVCQLGDLFISYIKRKARIKDTGSIFPGHGGMLDRVDGIIFAVPSAFLFKFIIL